MDDLLWPHSHTWWLVLVCHPSWSQTVPPHMKAEFQNDEAGNQELLSPQLKQITFTAFFWPNQVTGLPWFTARGRKTSTSWWEELYRSWANFSLLQRGSYCVKLVSQWHLWKDDIKAETYVMWEDQQHDCLWRVHSGPWELTAQKCHGEETTSLQALSFTPCEMRRTIERVLNRVAWVHICVNRISGCCVEIEPEGR